MTFFTDNSMIHAISWTLVHSLWIGLAAALLAGLTIVFTRNSTSAIRYNLLAAWSVLFLLTIGFVFYYELETPKPLGELHSSIRKDLPVADSFSSPAGDLPAETASPLSVVSEFISNHASWIVFAWFLVFLFKCFRMTGALRRVYRMRNYQTVSPPEMWQQRLSELQELLRIKRAVKLLESRLVSVPSVSGFFKPVILVPVGLLNNIPQDQVEAILLHELAHIRRSDYAVNLMQTVMEILFFFNPGILWISSLLKDEREHCCDDLAIGVTNNKKEFVNALISFQEYHLNKQAFALQFGDRKMKLAERAKRILFNNNKKLNTREKYFLSFCVLITAVLFLVVANVNASSSMVAAKQQTKAQTTGFSISDTLNYDAAGKFNPKDIQEGVSMKYVDEVDGKKSVMYIFKDHGVLYQVSGNMENVKVNNRLLRGKEKEQLLPKISGLITAYEKSVADNMQMDHFGGEFPEVDLSGEERIIDEASRIIDIHSAKIDAYSAIIDKHTAIIDEQVKIIDEEAKKESAKMDWKKHDEAQRRIAEAQRKIEIESKKIDFESRKINEQSRKIDKQSRKIEAKLKRQEKQMRELESKMKREGSASVKEKNRETAYQGISTAVLSV